MARKIPVADKAIAQVALDALYEQYLEADKSGEGFNAFLLEAAARVQFQPSTRRLALTFDLGMSSSDEPAGT